MTSQGSEKYASRLARLPLIVGFIASITPFLIGISTAFDLGQLAYFLLAAPFVGVALLGIALLRRNRKSWLTFLTFSLISWCCWKGNDFLRAHGRWVFLANKSKADMLAQPNPLGGELRHIRWDGWGMFAQDTEVYLVNDPISATISIQQTANGLAAKGIPCTFWRAYKLEPHWYAVVYFANTGWNECAP